MATDAVRRSAERVREKLQEAFANNHYRNGWYAHIDRNDIERMVEHILGPVAEETFTVAVTDGEGSVLFTRVIGQEEFERDFAQHSVVAGGGFDPLTNKYIDGKGMVIGNLHDPSNCEGRGCVIHNPSEHHMADWPTNYRTGGVFDIKPAHMERVCEHGVGHPDPDDVAFFESVAPGKDVISTHGCDGCCRPPDPPFHDAGLGPYT